MVGKLRLALMCRVQLLKKVCSSRLSRTCYSTDQRTTPLRGISTVVRGRLLTWAVPSSRSSKLRCKKSGEKRHRSLQPRALRRRIRTRHHLRSYSIVTRQNLRCKNCERALQVSRETQKVGELVAQRRTPARPSFIRTYLAMTWWKTELE